MYDYLEDILDEMPEDMIVTLPTCKWQLIWCRQRFTTTEWEISRFLPSNYRQAVVCSQESKTGFTSCHCISMYSGQVSSSTRPLQVNRGKILLTSGSGCTVLSSYCHAYGVSTHKCTLHLLHRKYQDMSDPTRTSKCLRDQADYKASWRLEIQLIFVLLLLLLIKDTLIILL